MRAILDFHPEFAVPDESNFVPLLGRDRARYERPHGFVTSALLHDLFQQRSFRRWGLTREQLLDEFDARPPRDYPDAVRALFGLYARRQGKARYADKTPRYLKDIPLLAQLFPESRFVHIIRDGRDVALSVLEVDFGARNLGGAALTWKDFVTEGRRSGTRLGPRYCEIHYEDILEDPEAAVVSLCRFIDVRADPAMLRYFEDSQKITAPAAWSRRHVVLPPTKGLRDWRTQMTRKDAALFEALAGDLLEELGYERSVARASKPLLFRSRAEVLVRKVRGLARTTRRSASGRRQPKEAPPAPLFARPGGDRQEVLSFLLAREAAADPDVMAYREQCLEDRLLPLEQVATWIVDRAREDGTGLPAPSLEYLGVEVWPLRQPTTQGGSLDRLRLLGARLAHLNGWEQGQATSFVLTGLVPLVPAIRSTTVGGVPSSSTRRIVLEVDPVVSPRDLSAYYERARAPEAQDGYGVVTEKQCRLAVLAADGSERDWPELLNAWNDEYPQWSYEDAKAFQRDAVSARRRVLDPR